MTVELLHRVRRSMAAAMRREIEDLREEIEERATETPFEPESPDLSKMAEDLEWLIKKQVQERDNDRQFLERELASAGGKGKARLDRVNRNLQKLFALIIQLHEASRELARVLSAVGYQVGGLDQLDQATEDYRRWIEDLPERAAMEYPPVKRLIKERLSEALKTPGRQSDWRKHFAEGEEAAK